MTKAFTTEEYKTICSKLHNNFYDYSLVEYETQHSVLKIICPKHGVFGQKAGKHIVGRGCPKCAADSRPKMKRLNAANKFVNQAKLVEEHLGRHYSYDKVVYTGARENVIITCPIHSDFDVTPNNHLRGKGCPGCGKTGYDTTKPGMLYVLTDGESITKIGITNKSLRHRVRTVSRTSGKNFEVSTTFYFDDGSIPDKIETLILKEMRLTHEQPTEKFDGSTECFLNCDHIKLLSRIEQLISQQTAAQAALKEQHSSNLASQEA